MRGAEPARDGGAADGAQPPSRRLRGRDGAADGKLGRGSGSGAAARLEPIAVNRNRDVCGDARMSEALVLGPGERGQGQRDPDRGRDARQEAEGADVVLDNSHCLFVSHVSAAMAGERVPGAEFRRRRCTTPTVARQADRLQPGAAQPRPDDRHHQAALEPGVIRVVCDAHPHMVGVADGARQPLLRGHRRAGRLPHRRRPARHLKVTMWHEGFRPKGVDKDGAPGLRRAAHRDEGDHARAQGDRDRRFELK